MKLVKVGLAALMGLAAIPALAPNAYSDTLPAIAGQAFLASEAGCFFQNGWAAVSNSCATTKGYNVSIPNGFAAGARTFRASSTGAAVANSPDCIAYVISRTAGLVWSSGTALVGNDTLLGTSPGATATTDTFVVGCQIKPNGTGGLGLASVRVN